jgi:dihydrofolate synthase/folylpolyglutamate synthase
MSYRETLNYLYDLQKHGIKFGLDNISRLICALDNPHKSFHSVHVAGTNGKGSASAIIASVLKAAGLKVGLFTSPHIVSFTERIKVNGEEPTEKDIIELAEEIKSVVEYLGDFSPTFFEVVTAMALLYFKRKKIDIAVIEVGMGGRLDATNIVTPEVSVLTSISYDHKEFLGSTLGEIAYEKAGIIKREVPVVISYQESEVIEIIKKKAAEKNAELYAYGKDFSSALKREDISGICFDYMDNDSFTIHDLILPLIGEHQMQNASVAIKAAMIVLKNRMQDTRYTIQDKKNPVSCIRHHESCIRDGLAATKWPGRLEMIKEEPPMLIDGAHNPAAAMTLSKALEKVFLRKYKKIIIVLGIMGDKDIRGIMEPLLPLASEIILTAPAYSRAASSNKLVDVAASLGFFDVWIAPTVKDAIEMAIEKSQQLAVSSQQSAVSVQRSDSSLSPFSEGYSIHHSSLITHHKSLILITGSFYTIGEAKEVLGQKGVLANLRE